MSEIFKQCPREILEKILKYLSLVDVIRTETVSKYFLDFVRSTTWDDFTIDKKGMSIMKNIMTTHKFTDYKINGTALLSEIMSAIKNSKQPVQLKKLSLQFFYNDEFINSNLEFLTSLRELKLWNSITKMLSIHESKLPDSNPTIVHFNSFTNLVSLTLGECETITDDSIQHIPNLRKIRIHSCSGVYGTCFKNFSKLENLSIYGSSVNPKYFEHLTNLKQLNIGFSTYTQITTDSLKLFKNPEKIIKLALSFNKIPLSKENIGLFTNLEKLSLNECNISDEVLSMFTNLHKLELIDCDSIIGTCLKSLSKLAHLICYYNFNIKNENLITCTNLRKLESQSCDLITNDGIKMLTQLEEIVIDSSHYITDEGLDSLKNCRSINLCNCDFVTGSCLKSFTDLKKLSVSWCRGMILKNVLSVPNDCILNITGCKRAFPDDKMICYHKTAESIRNLCSEVSMINS